MPKAVRFDRYGGLDVLYVAEVPQPVPGPGQVLVEVRSAAINPGEVRIREGVFAQRWPAGFPSGQGSDLAGVVTGVGEGVDRFAVGAEVIGYTENRASQAEFVLVEQHNLIPRPAGVPWEVAGSLYVAGTTAWAAVRAVAVNEGDTVVVSGAAGGVGSIAVQLARLAGARVLGLASPPNHEWLAGHGVTPVSYGEGVGDRIRAASGGPVDAFIDTFGSGYGDPDRPGVPADRGSAGVPGAGARPHPRQDRARPGPVTRLVHTGRWPHTLGSARFRKGPKLPARR